jgi:hypothetical protein
LEVTVTWKWAVLFGGHVAEAGRRHLPQELVVGRLTDITIAAKVICSLGRSENILIEFQYLGSRKLKINTNNTSVTMWPTVC